MSPTGLTSLASLDGEIMPVAEAMIPATDDGLVRGDLDCNPGPQIGDGDIRLRSMVDTLRFGIAHDWKQIIFGHVGRKPEGQKPR